MLPRQRNHRQRPWQQGLWLQIFWTWLLPRQVTKIIRKFRVPIQLLCTLYTQPLNQTLKRFNYCTLKFLKLLRHTPASGPENEGCGCDTYQFGCCPDGVTVAKGPNLQGCHCQYSKYGCCGDGQTAATGPDQGGCDCSTSKYGCCPDGQTEAKGDKFFGCTDVPENRQGKS